MKYPNRYDANIHQRNFIEPNEPLYNPIISAKSIAQSSIKGIISICLNLYKDN